MSPFWSGFFGGIFGGLVGGAVIEFFSKYLGMFLEAWALYQQALEDEKREKNAEEAWESAPDYTYSGPQKVVRRAKDSVPRSMP